ncbi:MAG TPA: sigma-70 family RNA polymerase sigma factor [Bacteroidales bacterium]|nr:sigma-70 family RNA polymerase sigma factor [Bacteroidales bacterium]
MDEDNPKYEITSDTLLWNNFRSGDEKSFENIYRTYVKPLYHYGSKFTNDKNFVLDCIQEVFVDIFTHRHNLGETNNIKLYLFVALKRKIICSLHKNNLIQSFPDEILPFLSIYSSENEIPDFETDPGKINKLNKALKMLSPRQKEAIYLRFVSELRYEEMCQIMNLNYQSVRNLVHRAIEKLRKIIVCSSFFLLILL